jgi:hypothetical protein
VQNLKLSVPTYYGTANCKQNVLGAESDFDEPTVPVLIHEADGVRVVLGTHDLNDLAKPDIQIERRPNGWAIFLHPLGGCDASGYVYFLDDGRSFLLRERASAWERSIEILRGHKEPPELDEIDLPKPEVRAGPSVDVQVGGRLPAAVPAQPPDQKLCARCGEFDDDSGDWYDDLCPACADRTDGDWICRVCARRGSFESMGGSGASDPNCCNAPCRHLAPE